MNSLINEFYEIVRWPKKPSDKEIVINSIKNTAKLGKSDWTVLEADESDGSFLQIPFNYSIVTNAISMPNLRMLL